MLPTKYPPVTHGKIVVWGQMARWPFGGMIWQVLHHLVALRCLGFDVWYVEDSDRIILDPVTYDLITDCTPNVKFLSQYMESIGLGERWIFRPPDVYDMCLGATDMQGLLALYNDAEAAFNLCGSQELRHEHCRIRCLVYLETDPVKNQVAVANGEQAKLDELDAYHYLFTYGENLGAPDCRVPIERYRWHPTRPPVWLDWWSTDAPPPPGAALTSVANWKHKGNDVVWQGEAWRWSKHYEFERFMTLPTRSVLPLELAVGAINAQDRRRLHEHGWRTIPSGTLARPDAYRHYIQTSLGEYSVAKEQYVVPRTGWFSDRSVCYLAAGRPVIMQDTGFGKVIPTGTGLFAYTTADEAVAAIEAISRDYARHAAAARDLARAYFDAEHVLGDVLRTVGLR
jgi:hypothetical protein